MGFIRHLLEKHRIPTIAIFSILIVAGAYFVSNVFAQPFDPGDELDPSCLPGSTNCFVDIGGMAIGGTISNSPVDNSVLFVGASGILDQDSTDLTWDSTNNIFNVGDPSTFPGQYNLAGEFFGTQNTTNSVLRLGKGAGASLGPSATENTFIGIGAGQLTTSAQLNVFVGDYSGFNNEDGSSLLSGATEGLIDAVSEANTFIGSVSGGSNNEGSENTFLGALSGLFNDDGDFNVFLGSRAGLNNISGSSNIFIGKKSGYTNSVGDNNVLIGNEADVTIGGIISNSIALGAQSSANNSNQFAVGGDTGSGFEIDRWKINGVTYFWPSSQGGSSTVLTNDGSGNLSWAAGGGGSLASDTTFGSNIQLTGVSYPRAIGANLAAGDSDLYTVPVGKKAFVFGRGTAFNTTGTSIIFFSQIKVSGTYYRISNNVTAAGGGATANFPIAMVLNAGETLSVNTDNSGLNYGYTVMEFDSSNSLSTSRVLTLAGGHDVVYTVPVGKTALLMNAVLGSPAAYSIAGGPSTIGLVNDSGGSVTLTVYNVPSGGTPDSTNQFTPSTAVADNTINQPTIASSMNAGDFINVHSSSGATTQSAFVTYYEISP